MNLPILLAEAGSPDWASLLSGAGVAGVVLAWFMFRAEARMKESERRMAGMETAQNRTTRAILLLVLSLEQVSETARAEAAAIGREIDESEQRRKATEDPT